MKLDLRPMLRGEVSRLPVNFTFKYDDIDFITVIGDARVNGEIVDTAGYMRMSLTLSFDYEGECARCLAPVKGCFETIFERTVVNEKTLTKEQIEEDIDEYAVIYDGYLDVDEQLMEAMLFDFPTKLLCREDCPGLCQHCGKPLKDGTCDCKADAPDPRWAVLKNFFADNGEENKE